MVSVGDEIKRRAEGSGTWSAFVLFEELSAASFFFFFFSFKVPEYILSWLLWEGQ